MGDFVQSNNVKTAVRKLANPIPDVAAFDSLVQSVITTNPFGCVTYMEGGISHQPVEKSKESYTAKISYENTDAKVVGSGSHKFGTVAGFNAGITAILADAGVSTAHAGIPARNADSEAYSATLRCHDPNGELYFITLSRKQVTITSFSDDAIRTKVETWADTVPGLA